MAQELEGPVSIALKRLESVRRFLLAPVTSAAARVRKWVKGHARRLIAGAIFGAVAAFAAWVFVFPSSGTDRLTAALTLTTAVYGWFTSETVAAMHVARSTQLMPKLVPILQIEDLDYHGSGYLRIVNYGLGPAFGADLTLTLTPNGERWNWKPSVVTVGEGKAFTPMKDEKTFYWLDELTATFPNLRLTGTCKNALGELVTVSETLDIREYWEMRKAVRAWVSLQDEPGSNIVKAIDELRGQVSEIRKHITGRPF